MVAIASLLAITSCSSSSDPKSLASSHLDHLKTGGSASAQKQSCNVGESLRLHTVKGFEVVGVQPKSVDGLSYQEVVAKVDTDQTRLKAVEKEGIKIPESQKIDQVTIEVWESDLFFNRLISSTAKINDSAERVAALTGAPATKVSVPTRDKVSSDRFCVFLPYEQFENEKI